jgi:DNA-binding GntR family transcriptional regulator
VVEAAPGQRSLTTRVYAALKEDIIRCVVRPGEVLHESVLAARYDVSKTPVRDALNMLHQEGYVQVQGRRGWIVSRISFRDVQDVFQLRLILEPPAAALAARRMDADTLAALQPLARIHYTHGDRDSYRDFLTANRTFHSAVAQASGNRRLSGMVEGLLEEMERFFHLGLDARDASGEMVHEHEDLVGALAVGDGDAAERITREQILASRKRVLQAILGDATLGTAAELHIS